MEGAGGYDYDVADDGVYDDFYCPICTKLLRDAVELECEHTLCSSCLNEWEKNTEETQLEFNCPECRRPIDLTRVQNSGGINRIIKRSVRVKCEMKSDGCDWIGVIIDMEEHLQTRCLYFTIPCEHDGCTELVQRINMNTHRSSCMYRNVVCQYCAIVMRAVDEQDHLIICDMFPVKCKNEGCGDVIPRQMLSNHHKNNCKYQLIKCQYSGVGCRTKILRLQIDQHEKEFMARHMSLMLQNNLLVQKELESTKQNLEQTKEKLENTTDELQHSKEDLEIAKDKFEITSQELEHAKEELETTKGELEVTIQELQHTKKDLQNIKEICENNHKSSNDFEVKYFVMLIKKEFNIGFCNWDEFLQSSNGSDNFSTITTYLKLSYSNYTYNDKIHVFQESPKTVREIFEKLADEHKLTPGHAEHIYNNFLESTHKDALETISAPLNIFNTISQFLHRFVGEKDDKFYDTSRVLLRTIEFCEDEDLHDDWTLVVARSGLECIKFKNKRKGQFNIIIPKNLSVKGVAVMRPLWNTPIRLQLEIDNEHLSYRFPVKFFVEKGCGEFFAGKLFILIKFQ